MRVRPHPLLLWPPVLVVVVVAACLVAAPTHDLLIGLGILDRPADPAELDQDFLQVLRRLILIPLAVLFLAFYRPWRDGGLLRFGIRPTAPRMLAAARVFALTAAMLIAVLAGQMLAGWLDWEDPPRWGTFAARVARYLAAGLLIATIEEWFFRGWLGLFAARVHGPRLAVLVPPFIYAVVHAFRPTVLDRPVSHDAAGAFEAVGGWLAFATDVAGFGPVFVGLFLFALLLTALYRRSGSLWPAIACHAAGILVIFSYGALTERDPQRTWAGTRLLYDGPVVWAILALATWFLWPRTPSPDTTRAGPDGPPDPGGR